MSNRAERRRLARTADKALRPSRDDEGPRIAWQIVATPDGNLATLEAAGVKAEAQLREELGDRIRGPVTIRTYGPDEIPGLVERFTVAGYGTAPAVADLPSWLYRHGQARAVVAIAEAAEETA